MRSDEFEYFNEGGGDDISAEPGLYKTKLTRGGNYVPVEIIEIIERDDAGHIKNDVFYKVLAWPDNQSEKCFEWEYLELRPFFLRPIDKDEFKWLMMLKAL